MITAIAITLAFDGIDGLLRTSRYRIALAKEYPEYSEGLISAIILANTFANAWILFAAAWLFFKV
jgi:hypothetical protein